jgi:hypothetical protein
MCFPLLIFSCWRLLHVDLRISSVEQFLDAPNVVRHTRSHRRRDPQRAMNPHEIVMGKVQPQSRREVFNALAERIRQPR